MDIPDSIPSLTELIKANADWGPLCHWPIKTKDKQKARTCKKRIDQNDVQKRDELIKEVAVGDDDG
jgi:hypothetical protein